MNNKSKPGKAIIKADTPFKSPSIPELNKEKNEIILGLLSSLLEPIGRHRAAYVVKSSSKKSKKRKRPSESDANLPAQSQAPELEMVKHLTVGLNSTSRQLEVEAALSKPGAAAASVNLDAEPVEQAARKRLAVVLLPKPRDNLIYAHLPLLCYTSSVAQKDRTKQTRLVLLDSSCERTIAAAMGLPRAGVVGIFDDTPGAAPLLEYVRENVDPVEVPWLEKALSGQWMGISIDHRAPSQT